MGEGERRVLSYSALREGAWFANSLTLRAKPGERRRVSNLAFIGNLVVPRRGVFEVENIGGVRRSVLRSVVFSLLRPLLVGPPPLF